jgi:hypothetical protein
MVNIYYIIFLLFIIAILVIFGVWNSNIHKNPKYRSLLSLLGALTIMFSSFAIILQVYTFNASQADSQIQIYEQMFDDLFAAISTYFETNPKLNYYYNDMFHPLNYNQSSIEQRLYTEEMQVTISILQKIASIVYFIENDKTLSPVELKDIEEKLDKLIRNMVKSHIFVENYKNIKLNFVSESLSNYMHKHYNI